nr:RNA-directed DNA polymerase, eukaryota, reverse transcriptase zinc-binding domain protein [Tanacetum cinerariifolium]
MYQVFQKLKSLEIPLNKLGWSKGNLFKRVESLRGQIQKVKNDIDNDPHNHSLIDMKAKLMKEFYEAEEDEEKRVGEEVDMRMTVDVTDNKIKAAMFGIDDSKAPGPDGFTIAFLKKYGVLLVLMSTRLIGYFKGGRRLRQIEKDTKFQYYFRCKSLKLVHVCFIVDDLLVMCHGDFDSVRVIKIALDEFSACSGLLPNNSKSTVFFRSLCDEERNAIANVLPFSTRKLLVSYLGVPLIAKRLSVKDYGSLLDRIKSKLRNWKNISQSYTGRL